MFIFSVVLFCAIIGIQMAKPPEDAFLTIPEIIKKYGYPFESHHVTTEDGYILELHRIPPAPGSGKGRPILLHHGLAGSSDAWILLGPGKALGYLLADLGFDVWLANGRGNTYSKNHTTLDPDAPRDRKKFWDFSLNEMGVYDLPACIDYILDVSSQEELYYVGHSQGCGEAFVLFSERPEYNHKVKAFFAMAPGVYLSNIRSPLFKLDALIGSLAGPDKKLFPSMVDVLGNFDFAPQIKYMLPAITKICTYPAAARTICSFPIYFVVGYSDQLDPELLPVIYGHFPAGASTKQLKHFTQMIKSGVFRKYDYGRLANFIVYKQKHPPNYKLENARIPVYIYYSLNDLLVVPEDAERLIKEVPNLAMAYQVEHPKFTHIDFIYGKEAKKYVYDSIINILKNLESI